MKKKSDFLEKYSYKIKSLVDLKKQIKLLKKNKKIILCHGVFDIVHPGHVRHLAHAKSKADILIVSTTEDRFIKKGINRPHVPQNIRAANLAAFELVDFVIIDRNLKPLSLIKSIKPNYFAKGFEYSSTGLPKATVEEKNLVESYGGKMIFSPGDIVYSSTKILDQSKPDLKYEKLISLMKYKNINFNDLINTCKKFKNNRVHVVGDTIVDKYSRTNLIGGHNKTPTFSVALDKIDTYSGGAAIVAKHLSAAGANVIFTTIMGNDSNYKFVKKDLKQFNIKSNFLLDMSRPSTEKNVFITGNYRILKVDTLDNSPVGPDFIKDIVKYIKKEKSKAVIFSDFRHGIFNTFSIPVLSKSIPKNVFKVADSQVASRWGNITEFKNFDLITPNEKEARFALADQDSSIGQLSENLKKSSKYKNLILKLSDKGVFCRGKNKREYFSLNSFTKEVLDPVGAGDALLAYSTLSYLVSKCIYQSSIIGSIAAGLECEYDGNIPIKLNSVINKIIDIENIIKQP